MLPTNAHKYTEIGLFTQLTPIRMLWPTMLPFQGCKIQSLTVEFVGTIIVYIQIMQGSRIVIRMLFYMRQISELIFTRIINKIRR
jgi:hypothetical protein